MISKTAIVRARVKPNTKADAQKVLDKLGLSISDAINLLLVQIYIKQALPFKVELPEVPNERTCKILDECAQNIGLNKCKNIKDFYHQLGI
jgi:DNA-damage-inducible protein J